MSIAGGEATLTGGAVDCGAGVDSGVATGLAAGAGAAVGPGAGGGVGSVAGGACDTSMDCEPLAAGSVDAPASEASVEDAGGGADAGSVEPALEPVKPPLLVGTVLELAVSVVAGCVDPLPAVVETLVVVAVVVEPDAPDVPVDDESTVEVVVVVEPAVAELSVGAAVLVPESVAVGWVAVGSVPVARAGAAKTHAARATRTICHRLPVRTGPSIAPRREKGNTVSVIR